MKISNLIDALIDIRQTHGEDVLIKGYSRGMICSDPFVKLEVIKARIIAGPGAGTITTYAELTT